MGRSQAQNRDSRNRYRGQGRRKFITIVAGVLLAFLLYKFYFGYSSDGPILVSPIQQATFVGKEPISGRTSVQESNQGQYRGTGGVDRQAPEDDEDDDDDDYEVDDDDDDNGVTISKDGDKEQQSKDVEYENKKSNITTSRGKANETKPTSNQTDKAFDKATLAHKVQYNETKTVGIVASKNATLNTSRIVNSAANASKTINTFAKNVTTNYTLSTSGNFTNKSVRNISKSVTKSTNTSKLDATAKQELDCYKFRLGLNKTNNRMCQLNMTGDELLTEIIKDEASWKMHHIMAMENVTKANPNLVPIDIGSNTGTTILLLAKYIRKAAAVDSHIENLKILNRALLTTKTASRVTPMWYKVANFSTVSNTTKTSSETTTLDAIAKFILLPNETTFVTVSQDGYELEVLQGGKRLLNSSQVCFVLVNFCCKRTKSTGPDIVKFMQGYGFHPFKDIELKKSLKEVSPTEFDSGVVFGKNITDCLARKPASVKISS